MAESSNLESALAGLVKRVLEESWQSFREDLQKDLAATVANLSRTETAVLAPGPAGGAPVASAVPPTASVLATVRQSVSSILQPTGQADILSAFLQNAAGFAGRCALFVRRGDSFVFWRGDGLSPEASNALRSFTLLATQPGMFQDVSDTLQTVAVARSSQSLPTLQQAFGGSGDDTGYLFPIVVQGRVVAALYVDAGSAADTPETSVLEILTTVVGLSLETAAARAAGGGPAMRPSAAAAPVRETPASPPAEAPVEETSAASPAPVSSAAPAVAVIPSPPDLDSLPEEDRDIHRKAYRSARVAVQDLLAYPQNKSKIEEGRKTNALYRLLKEDIDKTRETYQKKYGQTAARSFDYLHYELVTKLAENNPEVLGSGYPGPVGGG